MTYVDRLASWGWRTRGRLVPSCHLLADTVDELHDFAARLGMQRAWFQPTSSPHYDLTAKRRARAVALGARELSRRELVGLIRRLRAADLASSATALHGEPLPRDPSTIKRLGKNVGAQR